MKKQDAKDDNLEHIRHSLAHLLAAAARELYPHARPTIGPAIENGFYYDFDFSTGSQPGAEDLEKLEKKMRELLPSWKEFSHREVNADEAREIFQDNQFKKELIDELDKNGETITLYKCGGFEDLCRGGHSEHPSEEIAPDSFKLDRIAGAYWRGSEKNPMLTRIYGLAFESKEDLEKYLWQQEEIKKWDHRKLGRELDLFSFHEEAPGFIFWHPKGMLLREALMKTYAESHKKLAYQTVSTPIILSEELWHRSGHWDNYKDKMYFTQIDEKPYAIKPMNCPGTILIYKQGIRSWRDLPLRFAEAGEVHRHEPSGTLHGLFRVRAFRQDDAHLFVQEEQIEKEVKDIIDVIIKFYKLMGFSEIEIELSTRPEKYIGDEKIWEKAENIFKKVLGDLNLEFRINEGDGAFYGPKIDFHIRDAVGRSWQCGTIQLDFFMPERFELEYIDKDGQPKRPVMIHRTVIGSIQRFTGIIIEHFHGAFPVWLAPVQIAIIPVSEKFSNYATGVAEQLKKENIRVELNEANETLGKRIREAELQKIPYVLVVGEKEEKNNTASVRHYKRGQDGELGIEELVAKIKNEIESKAI
jgi:threonyl-tRNA synthetase